MNYINYISSTGERETLEDVRQLDKGEKLRLLNEYNMSHGGKCYLSRRACKDFNNDNQEK